MPTRRNLEDDQGGHRPLGDLRVGRPLLRVLGAKRAKDCLQLLRNSIPHKKDYMTQANLVRQAMSEVARLIPPHWDTWAICIREFHVPPHCGRGDLIATANVLRAHDIDTPSGPGQGAHAENWPPRTHQREDG